MAILFDLDGVFYEADTAITGAAEVATWARDNHIPHFFITNTTSRPRSALVEKLARFGIHTDEKHILTPPVATANLLKHQQAEQTLALFITEATRAEFSDFEFQEDDSAPVTAVIVGDLGEAWNFKIMNQAFRLLMQTPPPQFIALGMTRYWLAEDGLRLDVAPFVVALEHASGVRATVMGKPATPFYHAAIELLGEPAENIFMIGDDIRGDIEGAQQAGLKAILVRTGKFRESDLQLGIQPDAVLESVCDLPAWWQQHRLA